MKGKKYLLNLILLLICVFTMCGCARVDIIRVVNEDYRISDKIVVEIDEGKLNSHGVLVEEVTSKLDGDFEALKDHIDDWKALFEVDYPDLYDEMKLGIQCGKDNSVKNTYSIYIDFSNIKMFYLFYGYYYDNEEISIDGALDDIGPFMNKIANSEYTTEPLGWFLYKYGMIASENPINEYKEFSFNGRNVCEDYSTLTGYAIEEIELNQIFSYPQDRLHSNADEDMTIKTQSMFAWTLTDKEGNFVLELYSLYPRSVAWYVLGLVISAIVVVVLIIVYRVKYKKDIKVKITKEDVDNE